MRSIYHKKKKEERHKTPKKEEPPQDQLTNAKIICNKVAAGLVIISSFWRMLTSNGLARGKLATITIQHTQPMNQPIACIHTPELFHSLLLFGVVVVVVLALLCAVAS